MTTMKITIGDVTARAELLEKEAPAICAGMKEAIPIERMLSSAKIQDKEVTFAVPFFIDAMENQKPPVPGDIAFWNGNQTICFFYDDLVPMGAICVWARIIENLEGFVKEADKALANQGARIKLELED